MLHIGQKFTTSAGKEYEIKMVQAYPVRFPDVTRAWIFVLEHLNPIASISAAHPAPASNEEAADGGTSDSEAPDDSTTSPEDEDGNVMLVLTTSRKHAQRVGKALDAMCIARLQTILDEPLDGRGRLNQQGIYEVPIKD